MTAEEDILSSLEKSQTARAQAVEFVGLDDLELDDPTIADIKKVAQQDFEKISGIIQQDANLKVHIKRHFAAQEDKKHKYSVVLHLDYPGNHISIDNVIEWNLKEALKMAMKELESRINRIFRNQGVKARDSPRSYSAKRNDI